MRIVNHEGGLVCREIRPLVRGSEAEVRIGTFRSHGDVKHAIQDFSQIAAEEYATSASVKSFLQLVAKCDCIPCGLRFVYADADVSLIAADLGPNC